MLTCFLAIGRPSFALGSYLHLFSFQIPEIASVGKLYVAHRGRDYFLVLLPHSTPLFVTFELPAKVSFNVGALGEVDHRLYE